MPLTLGNLGNTSVSNGKGLLSRPGTVILPIASGNGVIGVVFNANATDATTGYGDKTGVAKFEVWYSADRITFTRVANITPTAGMAASGCYAADLFADNSIALAWGSSSGLRYRKITFGTWSVSGETAVSTLPANSFHDGIDVSVSDSETVLIAWLLDFNTGTNRILYRLWGLRSGGSWEQIGADYAVSTVAYRPFTGTIAVAWAKGTLPGPKRAYMVIVGAGAMGPDLGFQGWCDSTTEAATLTSTARVQAFTSYGNIIDGNAPPFSQRMRFAAVAATLTDNTFLYGLNSVYYSPHNIQAAGKVSFDGTTVTAVIPTSEGTRSISGYPMSGITTPSVTIGQDTVNFLYNFRVGESGKVAVSSYTARVRSDRPEIMFFNYSFKWDNEVTPTTDAYTPLGGGGRNARSSKAHDMFFMRKGSSTGVTLRHVWADPPIKPVSMTPDTGAVLVTSTPALQVAQALPRTYAPTRYRGVWEFASNAGFTTNFRQFISSEDSWTYNPKLGTTVFIQDTLPESLGLTQGIWYVRAANQDAFGKIGPYKTSTSSFSVSHPPAAAEIQPSGDEVVAYGSGSIYFTWQFTDPSSTDEQTAFQVIVEDVEAGSLVYDSGKVTSSAESHIATIPVGAKEKTLRWAVKLWDKDDVSGLYSSYQSFYLADAPTVNVLSPTSGGTVTSGIPSVTFTPTSPAGRAITKYRAIWYKNGEVIYSSNLVVLATPSPSGSDITFTAPSTKFTNNTNYSVQVTVTDEFGLEGSSPAIPFSVAYVVPAAPTGLVVSTTQYALESGGYVLVTWNDTGHDADFASWAVYRRDDLIDPITGVLVEVGEEKLIGQVYETTVTYNFKDYYAPSNYKVNYLVKQVVNRFGDVVESANTVYKSVVPVSDSYWMIDSIEGDVIKLYNVTQDDYTDEYEEAEMQIIGRGRRVERGDRLGKKGSMTVQIRNSAGVSARYRKVQLERMKEDHASVYLRTPFGDVLKVYVGNMQVGRIAGVGVSEFVDVQVPYTEVYE